MEITLKMGYDDSGYWAEIKEDGSIVSATTCAPTKQALDVWMYEHEITREQYLKADWVITESTE